MSSEPLVDVAMGTYNHEKFIAQALESVLMQKTDFPYRIIICDDFSTDKTRSIIMSYVEKYPGKIITFFPDKHYGLEHRDRPYPKVLKQCTAKYIAMLEGDDYWTDPYKLQKQVDFLEVHPDCAICFHNVNVINDSSTKNSHPFLRIKKNYFTLKDVIAQNFIPTCSTMFRNGLFKDFPDWYYTMPMGDWPLHVLNAQHGDAWYIDELMASYRVHKEGSWSKLSRVDILNKTIEAAKVLDCYTGFKFKSVINSSLSAWHLEIAQILSDVDLSEAWRNAVKSLIIAPYSNSLLKLMIATKILKTALKKTLKKLLSTNSI